MQYVKKMIGDLEEVLQQDEVIDQVHALSDMVQHFMNAKRKPSFPDSPLLYSFGTIDIEQRLAMCWGRSWRALEHEDKKSVDFEILKTINLLQDYIIRWTAA